MLHRVLGHFPFCWSSTAVRRPSGAIHHGSLDSGMAPSLATLPAELGMRNHCLIPGSQRAEDAFHHATLKSTAEVVSEESLPLASSPGRDDAELLAFPIGMQSSNSVPVIPAHPANITEYAH
jgi:hypothetical protein